MTVCSQHNKWRHERCEKKAFCQAQRHVHSQTGSANIGSSLQPLQAQVLKAFAGWKVQAVCRLQVSLSQRRGVYVYYSLCRLHENGKCWLAFCMAFAGFGCPLQAHVHCLGKLMFSIAFTGSCWKMMLLKLHTSPCGGFLLKWMQLLQAKTNKRHAWYHIERLEMHVACIYVQQ